MGHLEGFFGLRTGTVSVTVERGQRVASRFGPPPSPIITSPGVLIDADPVPCHWQRLGRMRLASDTMPFAQVAVWAASAAQFDVKSVARQASGAAKAGQKQDAPQESSVSLV